MALQNISTYLKNLSKKKKILISIIIVLVIVGIGTALYINTKSTPVKNPVLGANNSLIDPNAMLYEGSIESVKGKTISLSTGSKTINIDAISRLSIFNLRNSTKDVVLQVGNTVAVRFGTDGSGVNKATSISKIDLQSSASGGKQSNQSALGRADNNAVLLNGNLDQQLNDTIGDIVEVNDNGFSINTNSKDHNLTFEINNANFWLATISDISNITPQSHARIWAREMGPRFRAIFIVIDQ